MLVSQEEVVAVTGDLLQTVDTFALQAFNASGEQSQLQTDSISR